jgi:hypothetical protein
MYLIVTTAIGGVKQVPRAVAAQTTWMCAVVQTLAMPISDAEDPRPVEPAPPDDDACCGNGCEPCIYDLYNAERERYFAALRAWEARQSKRGDTP